VNSGALSSSKDESAKGAERAAFSLGGKRMSVHRLRRKPAAFAAGMYQDGFLIAVRDSGEVDVEAASGEMLVARCPQHIPIEWLRAAVVVAPVEVLVFVRVGLRPVLWGVFPSDRHEAVRCAVHARVSSMTVDASEGVEFTSGGASFRLEANGEVVTRGRDVTSRASEVLRLKGGRILVN
jgi:hypothetical protein